MSASIGRGVMASIGAASAWPAWLAFSVWRRTHGDDRALQLAGEAASGIAGMRGIWARAAFYGWTLAGFGERVCIGYGSHVSKTATTVGDGVYVGRYCGVGLAELADGCMLSDGVQVLSGGRQHGSDGSARDDTTMSYRRVRIGRGAWIGANAVVMADVGDGAIIGAGAVVTKPVADGVKVAGVPAKPIGPGLTVDWTRTGTVASDAMRPSTLAA
ncbi:MAG: acyltransferase [Planctomycetota bacterium]